MKKQFLNMVKYQCKVTFFGNTLTLTDTIKDDKLQNLIWLNNFSFEASETAIKNGLETGINKTVDSVTYTNDLYDNSTFTELFL